MHIYCTVHIYMYRYGGRGGGGTANTVGPDSFLSIIGRTFGMIYE